MRQLDVPEIQVERFLRQATNGQLPTAGLGLEEVAAALGATRQCVHATERRALAKLRQGREVRGFRLDDLIWDGLPQRS